MPEEFLPFHSFYDTSPLRSFTEKLKEVGIDFKLEATPLLLDQVIIGTSSDETITVKLKSKDFNKAHQYLAEYFKVQSGEVDKSYYLFGFSNAELLEVVSKPDEWGYFDYQLAQQILKERNYSLDQIALENLKLKRHDELAKPQKASVSSFIIGYFFILIGSLSLLSPQAFQNAGSFSYLIVIISGLIGNTIYRGKKTLPDGQSIFSYSEKDRFNGKILLYISITILIACTLKLIIVISL
jgi:hypothetical protein